jgi:hypothetical protein
MAAAPNPRLRTVMAAFVRNLHAFAQEVGLTQDEYDLVISRMRSVSPLSSA